MNKITAQVAVEAIVNNFGDYDESTVRTVLTDAVDAGVAAFYTDMLVALLPEGQTPEQGVTPFTTDVRSWLEVHFPEGDAVVDHRHGCDIVSVGDECQGGCPIRVTV